MGLIRLIKQIIKLMRQINLISFYRQSLKKSKTVNKSSVYLLMTIIIDIFAVSDFTWFYK